MVISGSWELNDDGMTRPMLTVHVIGGNGSPVEEAFLIDTGADVTVFRFDLLERLGVQEPSAANAPRLQGLAGSTSSIVVSASLALKTTQGVSISIKGDFTALTDPAAIDTSILGRDVLAHFDVILSRRRSEVLLLAGQHAFAVVTS